MNLNSILTFLIRNWAIILIVSVILYFNFQPEKKKIIIVSDDSYNIDEVTDDDPRVKHIWEQGNTFIINNSYKSLTLESVSYSTYSTTSYTPDEYIIKSNSTYATNKNINYIFTEPPYSITVTSGGSTTRWHLRYSSSNSFY